MVFTAENILLIGAILIFCSILISKTGYRFGIPTLLLFLLVGMIFGTATVETVWRILKKLKSRTIIQSSNLTTGYISKIIKICIP